MLAWILRASIAHKGVVLAGAIALLLAGMYSFWRLPIDAVPDLTNTQVQVLTSCPSLGALDVERLVTAPVERALTGISGATELRSISRAGVSVVTVVFDDDVALSDARQRVIERMPRARDTVSSRYGVPEVGPQSTGLGEIFQFELRGNGQSIRELRTLLDWEVIPRLRMVSGVVDVSPFGGEQRTLELALSPQRMSALGVSTREVSSALESGHRIAGGGVLQRGGEALLVRGEGLIRSPEDLAATPVRTSATGVVLLGHVGTAREAAMLRWGAATRDGRGEVVVGIVMMLAGANARQVANEVRGEVARINETLPNGVRIEPFYDRTVLVNATLKTVGKALVEGGVLVVAVLLVLLRSARIGVVGALMIPLSMAGALMGMRALGLSGNLMSLGAIDFGLVVDGAMILLENALHHLAHESEQKGRALTQPERDSVVLHAALEVRSATAFGELVIALVYVPILSLEAVAGRMFRPMALTVLLALGTAFVLSLTLVPALAAWVLPARAVDRPSFAMTWIERGYTPLLRVMVARPALALSLALGLVVAGSVLGARMGTEFVPRLDEGALVLEVTRPPSTSLAESVRQATYIEQILRRFAEVETTVCKTGRPEIATDPMGPEQTDVHVALRPRDQWPAPRDPAALRARMQAALDLAIPGTLVSFSQPIEMRTNELVSGVRSDFGVRIYGENLDTLARLGARVSRVLGRVRGAADVRMERVEGMPVLRLRLDRVALARHRATADEVLDAMELLGGITVGEVLEGERRFLLRIRLENASELDRSQLERLPLRLSSGALVSLGELAAIERVHEPVLINREGGRRRLIVQANVRGRDLSGFALEAQRAVLAEVSRPAGYRFEWAGQYEHLARAKARLSVVIPVTLALILLLLYATFGEWRSALLIFANVPVAVTGAVFALSSRGIAWSVSALVGVIALFGIAVLNGLVLLTQVRQLEAQGISSRDAATQGAIRRLRPVLMTALVAALGFVPMAFATGEGAEVQRPLATAVIGGLITATALTLWVLPALVAWVGPARSPARSQ
ncbi:MAG: CusA/CzcA family heavy metal efflux RND transporter [Deltaproteobacteria bacterium]|nr:CusA/CzcA family heavy metal efflux RND transporter [Deltaproteobacteria bacterium]